MFSKAKFSYHGKQTFYSHLRTISGLLVVSLASISILNYYYLSSNNGIGALPEEAAYVNNQVAGGKDFSYYSSIFSNLSRGLPIDEGVSSTESLKVQQEDEGDNFNPTDLGP